MLTARDLAKEIAMNCAPVSVALTKYMLYPFLEETDPEKAERINHRYFAWTGQQPDAREGVVSYLEKREPRWMMKVPGDMPDFFPLDE
jgi:enoyl-CoA hydratase/carnithine racemase